MNHPNSDDRATPEGCPLSTVLADLASQEGIHSTYLEEVRVARHTTPLRRTPVVYAPLIAFIGKGQKRSYLGDIAYTYDRDHFLSLSVPMPVECEWDANPDHPLLVVSVLVDLAVLTDVVLEMDGIGGGSNIVPRGISTSVMTAEIEETVVRLLHCLKSPLDSRVLGRQIVRELLYRVLQAEPDGPLAVLARRSENFTQIARVLKLVHTQFAQPLLVEQLARQAGMSAAKFHQSFKSVTSTSPIQYIKRIRLDRAKNLITREGYTATQAAHAVGYESASQFGREFKRLFGVPPIEEAQQSRERRPTK